jgi:uncharacterized protein (DUF2249 family)/hemerythrin-like domain-containing protein
MNGKTAVEVKASGNGRIEELSRMLSLLRQGRGASAEERAALAAGMRTVPKLHPVHTLMEEHQFILGSLRELAAFAGRLEGYGSYAEMGADGEVLKGIAHHLVDAESHHDREEEVLFPRMEAHGVAAEPGLMKRDHVEFRACKRRLYQLAQGAGSSGDFAAFKAEVLEKSRPLTGGLVDHIFQEDTIVYQLALEVLSPEEWADIKRGCDGIGYCCFKPADQVEGDPAEPAADIDLRDVPMIQRLDTILSTWKSLAAGQVMRITNDKEPRPLKLLFSTKEKGKFDWTWEVEGPERWTARIRRLA